MSELQGGKFEEAQKLVLRATYTTKLGITCVRCTNRLKGKACCAISDPGLKPVPSQELLLRQALQQL
jgi:hypothetical protein